MNILNALTQIKSNPASLLSGKYNVPAGMNDPNQILQHLLNTGQIDQTKVNSLMSNAQQIYNMISKRA